MTNSSLSFLKTITIFILTLAAVGVMSAKEYEVVKHSIRWTGSMPAKTHTGLLTPSTSDIEISDEGVVERLNVLLDMNSVNVTDLEEGKMRRKLTAHFLSEDFFYTKEYPTSRFTLSEHSDSGFSGELEIRGVAHPISIPLEVTGNVSEGWTLKGSFEFDRQDFNVNYQNSGFLGAAKDKLIRDEVTLDIVLVVAPVS